jgi:CubicO group peptidase (beta-lactamase class C family)
MSGTHTRGCLLALALFVSSSTYAGNPVDLPKASSMFSWSESQKVIGFSHTSDIFPTESFHHGDQVYPLPQSTSDVIARAEDVTYQYGLQADGSAYRGNTVQDYMQHSKAAGLLVIKNGAIALEKYAMGIDSATLWDSKSVGKSVVSTLMGIAIKQGYITSLDDAVEKYIPELKASAYQGVNLRTMLQMASGVAWQEDELEPDSDIKKLLLCGVKNKNAAACTLNFMKKLKRVIDPVTGKSVPPGVLWNYSSGEAYLSGLVVQRATKMSLGQYLQKSVWQSYGMEADGKWIANQGVSMGAGGFNATLRDYGRFGLFVQNNGVLKNGTQLLPDHWVKDAITWTTASATPGVSDNGQYGYMWWFSPATDNGLKPAPLYADIDAPLQNTDAPKGAIALHTKTVPTNSVSDWTFAALGIYGQLIAINQSEHLVVVQWSVWDKPDPVCCDKANPEFDARDPYSEQAVFLNAILQTLH